MNRPKKRMGPMGCILLLFGVLITLFVVTISTMLAWRGSGTGRVEQHLDQLRAKGMPTSAVELRELYQLPDDAVDVTAELLAILRVLESPQFNQDVELLPIVGMSEEVVPMPGNEWLQLGEAEQLMSKYAGLLEALHQLTEKNGAARFDLAFEDGWSLKLDHAQQTRTAARLLQLEALVRAHHGDADGVARSIRSQLAVARCLDREPLIISSLIRFAIDNLAGTTFQELLPHVAFSDQQLELLKSDLQRVDYQQQIKRGVMGDRVMGMIAFKDPDAFNDWNDEVPIPLSLLSGNRDFLYYLQLMDQVVTAIDQPWTKARRDIRQVTEDFERGIRGSLVRRFRYPMTVMLMPAMEHFHDGAAQGHAQNQITQTVIAIEQFYRRHDAAPESLKQLVPDYLPQLPVDAFSDGPLIMLRRSDRHVIVYSLGPDLEDDGGVAQEDRSGDIIGTWDRRGP